jgi:hypothetical protein
MRGARCEFAGEGRARLGKQPHRTPRLLAGRRTAAGGSKGTPCSQNQNTRWRSSLSPSVRPHIPQPPHDTRPQTLTTTCPRLVLDIEPRPSFTDPLRRSQLICPLDFTVLCVCRLRPPSYSFSSPPSSCPVHSTLADSIPLTVEWRSIAKTERDRTRH